MYRNPCDIVQDIKAKEHLRLCFTLWLKPKLIFGKKMLYSVPYTVRNS